MSVYRPFVSSCQTIKLNKVRANHKTRFALTEMALWGIIRDENSSWEVWMLARVGFVRL